MKQHGDIDAYVGAVGDDGLELIFASCLTSSEMWTRTVHIYSRLCTALIMQRRPPYHHYATHIPGYIPSNYSYSAREPRANYACLCTKA